MLLAIFFYIYRKCFLHKVKQDFMKSINYAVKDGGFLTCSLRDNEFGEFLLLKKRTASQLTVKKAVSHAGLQLSSIREIMPSSVWVLGPDIVIGKDGKLIDPDESNFVWISHLNWHSTRPAVPVSIFHPLQSSGLHQLVVWAPFWGIISTQLSLLLGQE